MPGLFLVFFSSSKTSIIGYFLRRKIRLLVIWCFSALGIRANVTEIGLVSITGLYSLTRLWEICTFVEITERALFAHTLAFSAVY